MTSGAVEWSAVQELNGDAAGFAVSREHLSDRRGRGGRGETKHLLNCTRDTRKRDSTFEEGGDGDLVGCIEGDAV